VARATERAGERSLPNVSFVQGDPAQLSFDAPFDAVVGRYVLQFQHDPGAMLGGLLPFVRPGGLIAFHELDWGGVRSVPSVPTYDRCSTWLVETLQLSGTEEHMGAVLHKAFVAAGLAPPTMRLEALLGCGAGAPPLERLAELVTTLLPAAQRLGAGIPDDLDVDTVLDAMRAEAGARNSMVVGHFEVGAWSHR
jgi:SAM-dependent methyltransferase